MNSAKTASLVLALVALAAGASRSPGAPATTATEQDAPWSQLAPVVALFSDEFGQGINETSWLPWGEPRPVVLDEKWGRSGVFDNQGDGEDDSGVRSVFLVHGPEGFVLETEVFLEVTDPAGCWLTHRMLITRDPNEHLDPKRGATSSRAVAEVGLVYLGDACWGEPAHLRRHAWLRVHLGQPSYVDLPADHLINRWARLQLVVAADGRPTVSVDGAVVYESAEVVDVRAFQVQRITLGGRSRGSAGKVWLDRVAYRALRSDETGGELSP